jgi:hypothetical protein
MSLSTKTAAVVPSAGRPSRRWSGPEGASAITVLALVLAGLIVAGSRHPHLGPVPSAARGLLAGLLLFVVSGDALAVALVPPDWRAPGRLMALPIGAAVSGLALTALGLATIPLHVSLWLVLATGAAASVLVRRRRARPTADGGAQGWTLGAWVAALAILIVIALAPAWRTGMTTIFGENPDAHQVVGIAVLFQHVSPTGTDVALPIDTVPSPWRFRYPIFYPLAGASNIGHLDPITVFPAMAALLLACLALGFGAFAVLCLRAPPWAGPAIGAAVALSVATLHIVWHPYWNQLWGLAMFPWALLFGWRLVTGPATRGVAVLFALMLLELGLAYPLALPYPLLIIGVLAIAHRRYLLAPQLLRSRSWIVGLLAVLVLAPAVAGAAIKLGQGIQQLLSSHSGLWGGDITTLLPVGDFVGTGGGAVPAFLVLIVAGCALARLPRRSAVALGISLAVLCLLDLRFRLAGDGAYMDFKHLSFVGALVLTLAATGVTRLLSERRGLALAGGAVLALAWAGAAVVQGHRESVNTPQQVNAAMLQIRQWAARLEPDASVRVDIPPSGVQLWAVYMLGRHPVDSLDPVVGTTYAHAAYGGRADYSLSLRYTPSAIPGRVRPYPRPPFAVNPPLARNYQFVLRRIRWPRRLSAYPDTASERLVEP